MRGIRSIEIAERERESGGRTVGESESWKRYIVSIKKIAF